MELEAKQLCKILNELNLKRLTIIIKRKFNANYFKYLYEFFELFKISVLNNIIYENKYFYCYKKLYSMRNLYAQSQIISLKNKIKKNIFQIWYKKASILNIKYKMKYNSNFYLQYIQKQKLNSLMKIKSKSILENKKVFLKIPIIKAYLFLIIKCYNYLIDNYYIKSIAITKGIYNYFRKKIKIYKAIFFSRVDYYIINDESFYVYKYILLNYINNNSRKINYNKKSTEISLLCNINNIIKFDYIEEIKILLKKNNAYMIFDKNIFNKIFINKYEARVFSIWEQKSLKKTFIDKIESKEIFKNNLIYSKLFLVNLILKKKVKNIFNLFFYLAKSKKKKKLLSQKNIEIEYNEYLFNNLKGIYKIHLFNSIRNNRIYNLNDNYKKLIALIKWKGKNNIIYIYKYDNFNFAKENNKIIKGCFIFNKIYFLYCYKNISDLINLLLKNIIINYQYICYKFKLILYLFLIQQKIINKKKKKIFTILFDIFKKNYNEKKDLSTKISLFYSSLSKCISFRIFKFKKYFIIKFIDYFNNIIIDKSKLILSENNKFFRNNSNYKKITKENKINYKLNAINLFLKYYQKNFIKNHYLFSKKFAFIHWSSFISTVPIFFNKISTFEKKEEEQDKIALEKEITELKLSLKEDQDFQRDLKAKITELNEENNFINEKIYEITQRVDKCEKCNNLLKSSFISDNNFRASYGSLNINKPVEENKPKKSRNMAEKEVTSSSGFNFITAGTELIPKTPRGYNKNEEYSVPESIQIDDDNYANGNNINKNFKESKESIKQKIIELKREKEPIINKLHQEIVELYKELNVE